MMTIPSGMPKLEELLVDTDAMPWREKSLKESDEKCSGGAKRPAVPSP